MTKRKGEDPFDVGYGRPPKHSQFKPGQSGNLRGRPARPKVIDESLARELETKITVTEGGARKTMTKGQATAKRLVEKALKGDMQAVRYVADTDRNFAQKIEAQIKLAEVDERSVEMEPVDYEILRHFAEQARQGAWAPEQGSNET